MYRLPGTFEWPFHWERTHRCSCMWPLRWKWSQLGRHSHHEGWASSCSPQLWKQFCVCQHFTFWFFQLTSTHWFFTGPFSIVLTYSSVFSIQSIATVTSVGGNCSNRILWLVHVSTGRGIQVTTHHNNCSRLNKGKTQSKQLKIT